MRLRDEPWALNCSFFAVNDIPDLAGFIPSEYNKSDVSLLLDLCDHQLLVKEQDLLFHIHTHRLGMDQMVHAHLRHHDKFDCQVFFSFDCYRIQVF